MNNTTIVIIAHNEKEEVKLCVQSIRLFCEPEGLSVIIVDNNSTDRLDEWALAETNLSFIGFEELQGYSNLLNQVLREFVRKDDIMIITPHFLFTPGCLLKLKNTLYEKPRTGAVGPSSNGFKLEQTEQANITDFQQAIDFAVNLSSGRHACSIGLYCEVVMFRNEVLKEIGDFDESIWGIRASMEDYLLRIVCAGYFLYKCFDAYVFDNKLSNSKAIYETTEKADADRKAIREKWGMNYFNYKYHAALVNEITEPYEKKMAVLEIGCDCGANLAEVGSRFPNAVLYGVEINKSAANIASHVANITIGNIETDRMEFDTKFDYILLGDLLEHLHSPEQVIVYCKTILNDNGYIIASIPNLMHISVIQQLLNGNFSYQDEGLLDRTHIHFFTYNEIIKMFASAGYEVEDTISTTIRLSDEEIKCREQIMQVVPQTPAFMFDTFQYVLKASKSGEKTNNL